MNLPHHRGFLGNLVECGRTITRFDGTRTTGVKMRALVWIWEDNDGTAHIFLIPNYFYVPSGKARLLIPQSWANSMQKNKDQIGSGCDTNGVESTPYWNGGKSKLMIPLGENDTASTF
jgi:hypothetical protein